MKVLRTAALVVGAVALVASGIGAAAGAGWIGAAAGSAAAAAGAATSAAIAATATVVATAASVAAIGLSLAAAALYKRPGLTGSQTTFNSDPNAGIPYAMGRTALAGNIVYWDTNDTTDKGDNDRQTFVVVLSGAGPVEEIEAFKSDNVEVPFDVTGTASGFYFDWMWQKTQLGETPEAASLSIPGDPLTPPGWTADHKLSGYAAAMWRLRFDTKGKKYTNGTPKPLWVGKWVKVYDPRLDDTFPGGSGPCRALDESTYVWSENPFLHGLTWCLGRWQNGIRVLGIGALLACIDVPAFAEGANVADLNGWKIGGVAYSTDGKWDTLVSMLQAGCGEPMALGAKISCFVNAPKVSLATLGVGDLSGGVRVQATQSRRDRINGIIPRYRSEDHDWQIISAAPVRVSDYIDVDGGERTKEADYPFVQDLDQAATLARYGIENSREFGPISMPLRPRWIGYKPGDAITVTIPEVGLNSQKVLLTNREIDPASGCPRFTARSETDAKHPFALGETGEAPPTPGVVAPPNVPTPAEGTWEITGTEITVDGTSLPALVVEGAIDSASTEAIFFEYRESVGGDGDDDGWIAAGIEPPETLRKIITGVKPGVDYEVSVTYRRFNVLGDRLIIGPATVGVLTIAEIAAIVDDDILDRSEKNRVIQDVDAILREQFGIDSRATAQGITTEKTAYDNAVTALTTYLDGLMPDWDDTSVDTPVVRADFIDHFNDVAETRQAVLNRIDKSSYDSAVAAQTDATAALLNAAAAQANATAALSALTDIASDSLLTPGEKPIAIKERDAIVNEQAGIDARATAYGITTEKTNYDNAVSALTTYLATLTSPVLWSNLSGNTTIVGTTFRANFNDVYAKRQILLNKVAEVAGTLANWTGVSSRPKMFRIVSKGNSTTYTPHATGVFDESDASISAPSRSYTVAVFTRSTGAFVSSTSYDVFASSANASAMATALNALGNDKIVVVYTDDEPQTNLTAGLKTALYRCGASPAVIGSSNLVKYRSAYVLIGIPGIGEGKGFEAYAGKTDSATDAWLDVAFAIYNAAPLISGVSYTNSSVLDLDFTTQMTSSSTPIGTITVGDVQATINGGGGGVATNKVTTPAIVNNSVSQTTMQTMGGTLTGSGAFAWQDAISYSLVMPYAGDAIFVGDLGQGYSSGVLPQAWETRVTVDGTPLRTKGGAGWGTDSASIGCATTGLAAGSHTVKLQWRGDNANLQLLTATLSITAPMK